MACHRCGELQKELTKTKANFKALNEKIVSTDRLVKKYREKCLQLEGAKKDISEKIQDVEAAQRAVCTLRDQLETAMLRVASPSMDYLQLKSEHESVLKELQASRVKVDSQMMFIVQLEARIAQKDEELKQLELDKELRQEELAEAKDCAKRSGEQVEKLKKQKAEQKGITKELAAAKKKEQSLQKKLTSAEEKIKALKSQLASKNKKREGKLNGYSLPDVFSPTKPQQQMRQMCEKGSPERHRQNRLSVNNGKFSNGFFPNRLSPLPPSPQKSTTNQRKRKQSSPHESILLSQDQSIPSANPQLNESTDESQDLEESVTDDRSIHNLSCDQTGELAELMEKDSFGVTGNHSIDSHLCDQTGKDIFSQSHLSLSASCSDSELEENEKSTGVGIVIEKKVMVNKSLFGSLSDLSDLDNEMESVVGDHPLSVGTGNGIGEGMDGGGGGGCEQDSKEGLCEAMEFESKQNALEGSVSDSGGSQHGPQVLTDLAAEDRHMELDSVLNTSTVNSECQDGGNIDNKIDKLELSDISTEPDECKHGSPTGKCTVWKQPRFKGLQDKDRLSPLSSCQAVSLTEQANNHCNPVSISKNCHKKSSLPSSGTCPAFSTPIKSTIMQSEKLPSSQTGPPTVQPFRSQTLTKMNLDVGQTALFQILSTLEAKSNLSPLSASPLQATSTAEPPSSQSNASKGFESLLMSSRSQQMDKVIDSFRSSGYKRKLTFSVSSNSEDSLPSPKRFSAAVPTSVTVIRPKPIRHTQTIGMMESSDQSILSTVAHLEGKVLLGKTQSIAAQPLSATGHTDALTTATNQGTFNTNSGHGIIDSEIEEGELVGEPVEDKEKAHMGNSAKTVGQKSGVYNRPSNQTEDSYVTKGLQRLRRQPDDIRKIASGFAVQENISCPSTLAQGIAKSLCQRKDDVGKEVQAVCAEVQRNPVADFEPVMSVYEKLLLRLIGLVKIAPSQRGLVETLLHLLPRQLCQIKENKWNTAFSCGMRSACVCRFFASLCRQEGDVERLRVFCYDLLREFTPFTVKELLSLEAVTLVWPQAIRRQMLFVLLAVHPQLTCCVMEALLMTQFKCSTKIQCKVLDSICILLHWSQVPQGCLATQELAVTMIKFLCHSCAVGVTLTGDCPVLNPISFELVKCLELLSHWMGPSWMDGYLIRQLLWPVIKEWMSEKQHPHQGKPRHSAAPVATICRFLGCVGRMANSSDELLDRLVSILSSILAQVPAADEGIASVHLCSAMSLSDLTPWRPREVQSALKQWTSSVPGTDNSHRFPSLPNLLRHRMLSIT